METINAQSIYAAVLAAARLAPEYPDAFTFSAMPDGLPYGFDDATEWDSIECRTYNFPSDRARDAFKNAVMESARAELRAMLDIPVKIRIQTAARGFMRIVNTAPRLADFAATVKTNARAFGGGFAPVRRAPAAVKPWPAASVKLIFELLQDHAAADATTLAIEKCGASFYDVGKGPFMVWAPMPVDGLADDFASVRSSVSGKYCVIGLKSGLAIGETCATRKASEQSARQAVENAGPEKTAAALARAKPCDMAAARAAWFKVHGIDAAADAQSIIDARAADDVAEMVSAAAASAAIAQAMQNPADAAPARELEIVAIAADGAEMASAAAGHGGPSAPDAYGTISACHAATMPAGHRSGHGGHSGTVGGPDFGIGNRVFACFPGNPGGPAGPEPMGISGTHGNIGTRGNSEGNPQPMGISGGLVFEVDGHNFRQAFENSDDAMRAAMGCVYLNPARFGFHSAELSRTGCTAWTYGFSTVQVRAVRADGVADGQAVTFNPARREWVGTATIDAPQPVEISDVWGSDAEPHAIPGPDGNPAREWIRGAVCQVACAARISYRAAGILAAAHADTLRAAHAAGASVHDGARIVLDASAGPADPEPVENVASEPAAVEPVEIADTGAGAEPGAAADAGADAVQPVEIVDAGQAEPEPVEMPDYVGTGTYSPEDNKLRLYPFARLDAATYARVKAAGFSWAPKQEVFVAPMWTPARADLLAELVGEIDDEDGTMRERAADRADRFEDYQGKRTADAERARDAVQAIGARFEFGQPILIGHHSERKARKDKERMENGMRKAVQAWDTAQYWERRAAACVRHALYKERPDVRARRIKGLEADQRKQERTRAEAVAGLARWEAVEISDKWKTREDGTKPDRLERARRIADIEYLTVYIPEGKSYGYTAADVLRPDGERYEAYESWTVDQVLEVARRQYPARIAHADRWIQHYKNRIAYERAMLADAGGTVADKSGPEVGGACQCWASPRGGGWSLIQKVNRVSVTVLDNWGNGGADFTRTMPMDKLKAVMSRAQVDQARADGRIINETAAGFHLLSPKPAADPVEPVEMPAAVEPVEVAQPMAPEVPSPVTAAAPVQPVEKPQEAPKPAHAAPVLPKAPAPDAAAFDAMRQALRSGGVQVVTVPQLFATPATLAARMVDLADIRPGHRIMEPSAGTGRILDAIGAAVSLEHVDAIEINPKLADMLRARYPNLYAVRPFDFLSFTPNPDQLADRILMNPPFIGGADIKHIKHALQFLKPGGRLVAICAGGPRQASELRPIVDSMGGTWEPLPADTFKESGTGVNTVLLCVTAPDVARQDPPQPVEKPMGNGQSGEPVGNVTIEAMHEFLAKHYRPDRFTGRDGATWGARYSWDVARGVLEYLALHGRGQISHHESRTGDSVYYDRDLQEFDEAARFPMTAKVRQVQAWSARHFRAVLDWLEDMNHHGEALLIRALRVGSYSLSGQARELVRAHESAGYLKPDIAQRRAELSHIVAALENHEVHHG